MYTRCRLFRRYTGKQKVEHSPKTIDIGAWLWFPKKHLRRTEICRVVDYRGRREAGSYERRQRGDHQEQITDIIVTVEYESLWVKMAKVYVLLGQIARRRAELRNPVQ